MLSLSWVTLTCAALLFTGMCCFFFEKFHAALAERFRKFPEMVFVAPYSLLCLYFFFTAGNGGLHVPHLMRVAAYFMVPTTLVFLSRGSTHPTIYRIAAMLVFWIPLDYSFITTRWATGPNGADWPFIVPAATILGVILFRSFLGIEGLKFSVRWKDAPYGIAVVSVFLCALTLVMIPLALPTSPFSLFAGFLVPQADLSSAKSVAQAMHVIAGKICTLRFLAALIGILLTTGLAEEFLFRGMFQNLIEQRTRNRIFALAVASILFGAAHLEDDTANGVLRIMPELLNPSSWNWPYMGMATIAGAGYGLTYMATRSIFFAALLHALVDTIWGTLFVRSAS